MRKILCLLVWVATCSYAQSADADYSWLDSLNTYELTKKSTSFPSKEEYYASEQYPQYKFVQDKYKSNRWIVYDTSYHLLAVSLPTNYDLSYESFGNGVLDALVKYDYEHNAYNINQENDAVRKYVAYTANNGRSIESLLSSRELAQSTMDRLIAQARQMRATGRMTQAQYNKQLKDYNTTTARNKKEIATLRAQLPAKAVITRADDYIRQLRQDNRDLAEKRDFTITRIDGLTILLESPNGLKIQQIGFYNEKEKAVDWKYEIIEKPNL